MKELLASRFEDGVLPRSMRLRSRYIASRRETQVYVLCRGRGTTTAGPRKTPMVWDAIEIPIISNNVGVRSQLRHIRKNICAQELASPCPRSRGVFDGEERDVRLVPFRQSGRRVGETIYRWKFPLS